MDHKVEPPSLPPSRPDPDPIRSVEYVRVSTEHRQNSAENQQKAIRRYADKCGMVITRTYMDDDKTDTRQERSEER
jgi:DNA invertase Pin-like site-specific DNA recombinase